MFFNMGLKFEFPIGRCPASNNHRGWFAFPYGDWQEIKPQFADFVKTLPVEHAAALLDAGTFT